MVLRVLVLVHDVVLNTPQNTKYYGIECITNVVLNTPHNAKYYSIECFTICSPNYTTKHYCIECFSNMKSKIHHKMQNIMVLNVSLIRERLGSAVNNNPGTPSDQVIGDCHHCYIYPWKKHACPSTTTSASPRSS